MSKSNEIGKLVFDVVTNYVEKQNQTKLAYFTYLYKNKSVDDFKKVANKLWDDIDHKFMDKQIDKLKKITHEENMKLATKYKVKGKDIGTVEKNGNLYLKIVPEKEFNKVEQKFKNNVIKDYGKTLKSSEQLDLDTYLEKKLNSYDRDINQAIAYFKKDGGIARYVDVSTYLSMLHNTNLTRSAWNQTLMDADKLGMEYFIIPPHPFSCEECASMQGIPLSKEEVYNEFGVEEETDGDLLHTNCKCTLSILWSTEQLDDMRNETTEYNEEEKEYCSFYGKKIFEYSFSGGINSSDIPDDIIEDYINTRKRKFEINKLYIEWQKEGIIDTLII